MALFTNAIPIIFLHEGGLTTDTGGLTNFGISQKAYPKIDIKNLSKKDAENIYFRDYWSPLNLNAFKSQNLANAVLDMAVNAGTKTAAKMLQIALNRAGEKLVIDGMIGPLTTAAANRQKEYFVNDYTMDRIQFYKDLAAQNAEKYGKFLKGWIKRAEYFLVKKNSNLLIGALVLGAIGAGLLIKKR